MPAVINKQLVSITPGLPVPKKQEKKESHLSSTNFSGGI
jgi:hypothetical protein